MSTQTSQAIFPEVGDLVVATVKRVEDYGAYVKLDEFAGIEGLVHISEMATTWVRNIRDHAREGQKLVLKVLRVNPQRNQIERVPRLCDMRIAVNRRLKQQHDRDCQRQECERELRADARSLDCADGTENCAR